MERYIKEYAAAKTKRLKENDLMQPGIKDLMLDRIAKAIALRERGLITADETIRMILEA